VWFRARFGIGHPLPNQPLANKKGCCSYATQPERDKGVGVIILTVRFSLVNVYRIRDGNND
jgi:hypothetical protein